MHLGDVGLWLCVPHPRRGLGRAVCTSATLGASLGAEGEETAALNVPEPGALLGSSCTHPPARTGVWEEGAPTASQILETRKWYK